MSAKEPEITKEEQELLELLDEELALPPLPPDFISNVLALLGIPSDAPSIEDDTEAATSAHSLETSEELYQHSLEAYEAGNYLLEMEKIRLAAQREKDAQDNSGRKYPRGFEFMILLDESRKGNRIIAEQSKIVEDECRQSETEPYPSSPPDSPSHRAEKDR